MRILLVASKQKDGSLTPYVLNLAQDLRALGNTVTWIGSHTLPYDMDEKRFWNVEKISDAARDIIGLVDWTDFDIVSLHFGKLEIEQLFPLLLSGKRIPPIVCHMHSTDWDLFKSFVQSQSLYSQIRQSIFNLKFFIFFCSYAKEFLGPCLPETVYKKVIFYPASLEAKACSIRSHTPLPLHASMVGFYSPWKNIEHVVRGFKKAKYPLRFTLSGPLWNQLFDFKQKDFGNVQMHVNSNYVCEKELEGILNDTDFGLFPYNEHHCFQGSAAISNYLLRGVPIVGYDVANMKEYVGSAGCIVPNNLDDLVATLDKLSSDPDFLKRIQEQALLRARLFDHFEHAKACQAFFMQIVSKHGVLSGN